jgi:hypothetical protein
MPLRKISLPKASGKWLTEHIFQLADGRICFHYRHLEERFKEIEPSNWYLWLKVPNADLDRTIRAFLVPNPKRGKGVAGNRHAYIRVWLQEDADLVLALRTDPGKRYRPVASPGKWLTDEIWQDDEYGACGRYEFLCKHYGRSDSKYFYYWEHHRHPAIDPTVNEGKARSRRVPGLNNHHRAMVCCLADFDRIAEWDRLQESKASSVEIPEHWRNAAQIAADRKLTGVKHKTNLYFVLRAFRLEVPQAALEKKYRVRNRLASTTFYDQEEFDRWLAGRDVDQIAARLGPKSRVWYNRRLQMAVLFLQFVLTHGSYSPKLFGRFCNAPPPGPLEPCAPVPKNDVLNWSRRLGIGESLLRAARKLARVMPFGSRNPAKEKAGWYLEGPVYPRATSQGNGKAPGDVAASEIKEAESPAAPDSAAPAAGVTTTGVGSTQGQPEPYIPSPLQRRILEVLDGKALTADALEVRLQVDRKSLYRDGLNPLRNRDLVRNSRSIPGYYRPDAPPPEFAKFFGDKAIN